MMKPRLMIAGTHSGAGKTTVTLGLMAALRRRGYQVQGFKVGPDYIDPSYHTAITGRPSRNLDPWMMGEAAVREVFHRGSDDCDIAVVEGVMGLFDGRDPRSDEGSAAHVSRLLDIPVILVMDAASMARSAAAVVLGFQQMQPTVPLAGVIPNRVGGQRHYELVETAISSVSSVPVFGYLTTHPELQLPERHLGLIPALERGELEDLFTALAAVVEETIDVDGLLAAARRAPALAPVDPVLFRPPAERPQVTVAIARDHAFNFYYPENLELLAWHGAELVEFRPLAGECIPDGADGVYFGGGFPEEFADQLSQHNALRAQLQRLAADGMPIYGECGGFMYLTASLTDRHGQSHPMANLLPASVRMQHRLQALGYREVTALTDNLLLAAGEQARGHEFHYSTATMDAPNAWPYAYHSQGLRGSGREGYARDNILAGYTHLHFASNPNLAPRFVAACAAYRARRQSDGKEWPGCE